MGEPPPVRPGPALLLPRLGHGQRCTRQGLGLANEVTAQQWTHRAWEAGPRIY